MPAEIVRGSASLLSHVADPAARSIVLGCCAALVLAALRVKNVAIRTLVWRGVLVAALAMPVLALVVIPVRVSVPGPIATAAKYVAAPAAATTQRAEIETEALQPQTEARGFASELPAVIVTENTRKLRSTKTRSTRTELFASSSSAGREEQAGTALKSAGEVSSTPVRREISWTLIAAAIYLCLLIAFATRICLGIRFAKKLERKATTVDDQRALGIAAIAASASGLSTAPRLAECEMLSVPVTLGLQKPVILFPAEWREWEDRELEAVLAHEISHIARRDALVQRLAMIHRTVFWFSPFAWWLERHLGELSEQASDEAALAMGADRTRYAETLLGFFATLEAAPQRVWWQGVSMAKLGQAERRVDRILAWRGAMSKGLTKSLMVGLAVIAAPAVILTASVHPMVNNFQDPVVEPEQQTAPAPAARPNPAAVQGAPVPPAPSSSPTMPAVNGDVTPAIPSGSAAPSVPSNAPVATVAPEVPSAAFAPMAPVGWQGQTPTPSAIDSNSDEVREAYDALRHAQEAMLKAKEKADKEQAKAAKAASDAEVESLKSAKDAYKAAIASYKDNLKRYKASLDEAREIAEQAQAIGAGVSGGLYGGVSGGVGGERIYRQSIGNSDRQYRIVGNYSGDRGPRFVIVTKNSSDVTMSGTEEDAEHARALKSKIQGDFIWFERDEKSYIITDAGFISKAKALFAPQEELGKKQEALGRQQDELGRQQDALGKQMDEVKVKVPDITPDLEKVRSELDELRHTEGASQTQLGRLQSELGRMQSEIGRYQSDAGRQQSDIGKQQGELGRKQGELGRQQGELGRQQGELARKASRELRDMFSDAIEKGIAKPE